MYVRSLKIQVFQNFSSNLYYKIMFHVGSYFMSLEASTQYLTKQDINLFIAALEAINK